MRRYLLSDDFEKIYLTAEARIERLEQFRKCFEEDIIPGDEMFEYFTDLVNLCDERIKHYQEEQYED